MIGGRIPVESDRFDYVYGLLTDDAGLVPYEHLMPVGAAEIVVDDTAWAGVDDEIKREIARFVRPGGDVVVQPADDGSGGPTARSRRSAPSNPKHNKEQ